MVRDRTLAYYPLFLHRACIHCPKAFSAQFSPSQAEWRMDRLVADNVWSITVRISFVYIALHNLPYHLYLYSSSHSNLLLAYSHRSESDVEAPLLLFCKEHCYSTQHPAISSSITVQWHSHLHYVVFSRCRQICWDHDGAITIVDFFGSWHDGSWRI